MRIALEPMDWSSDFEVGIEAIDTEHRMLVILYNDLVAALTRPVSPVMKRGFLITVRRHLAAHFTTEEDILRNRHHPMADEHAKEHRKAEAALSRLMEAPEHMQDILAVSKILRGYIDHILIEDQRVFGSPKIALIT